MIIRELSVRDFRNFTQIELTFTDGLNVLIGENGSGKTSLLEAIFTLSLGRSHRGAADAVVTRQGAEGFTLKGTISNGQSEHSALVAYQIGKRKRVTTGGAPLRLADLYDAHAIVASGPEDSEILAGPPSARRLFLDIYISQISRTYLDELSGYRRSIAQKNAALKNGQDPTPFHPQLTAHGARIMKLRKEILGQLAPIAEKYYELISGGEPFMVAYAPSVPLGTGDTEQKIIEERFRIVLNEQAPREKIMQTALIGPHRDDMKFEIDGLEARIHGSRGQWRTAAVALKLALFDLLTKKRGIKPVLLLDELFAELDPKRSTQLMQLFNSAGAGQIFLTSSDENVVPLPPGAGRFRIDGGRVEELM